MRKRRRLKMHLNKKVIFITIIISMSFIGVGYASWNDTTNIEMSVKTGFILKNFKTEYKSYDNGQFLNLTISEDGSTLFINGKIFPEFQDDLYIDIKDVGTIRSTITSITDGNENPSIVNNNGISTLKLIIKPNINKLNINQNDNLKDSIEEFKNNINLYNTEENYIFNYTVSYELNASSWAKNLYIKGDIDIVPNETVTKSLELKLEALINEYDLQQLKIAEEQKLEQQRIEQEKLLNEQKLLEQQNSLNKIEVKETQNATYNKDIEEKVNNSALVETKNEELKEEQNKEKLDSSINSNSKEINKEQQDNTFIEKNEEDKKNNEGIVNNSVHQDINFIEENSINEQE